MDRSTLEETMGWLLRHCGIKRDLEDVWITFKKTSDQAFMAAVDQISRDQKTFPTLIELGSAICIAEAKIDSERPMTFDLPKYNTAMGQRVNELIERLTLPANHPKKLTSKMLAILFITEMEKEFPGYGWQEQGRQLLHWAGQSEAREEKRKTSIFVQRQQKVW